MPDVFRWLVVVRLTQMIVQFAVMEVRRAALRQESLIFSLEADECTFEFTQSLL